MSLSTKIKKSAMWMTFFIEPSLGIGLPIDNDYEKNMPLWVAIVLLVIEVALVALLIVGAYFWLRHKL
jgi:hypothetical protein